MNAPLYPTISIASRLADSLARLIDAEDAPALTPPIVVRADEHVIAAAREVADAVTRLGQVKYSSGEIAARAALERRALALKKALATRIGAARGI